MATPSKKRLPFSVLMICSLGLSIFFVSTLNLSATAQSRVEEVACVAHDYSINQWGNQMKSFNFPSNIGVKPRSRQISCVQLYGMHPDEVHTIRLQREEYEYRINQGNWQKYSKISTLSNNDSIYLRTTTSRAKGASGQTYILIDGDYSSFWNYQNENTGRSPRTWQVGPNRKIQQLTDITEQLVAGDIVELDGDATYHAVEFTQSGLADSPISIRGISINGKRPLISGNISSAKPWTLAFSHSHYYVLDNVEISAGKDICVRNMAHQITIQNTYIHDCPGQGILGTDVDSGTLILNHVEVSHAGSGSYNHAIYVATDGHQFPESKLRIVDSYIHDFRGNGIKSRAHRTELLANWIEQSKWVNPDNDSDHSYYSLELIGPDGYEPDAPLDGLVVGNVFVHKEIIIDRDTSSYGMRFGGDGTGYSWGRVWFTNNIVISPPKIQDAIFRIQYKMNSVYMDNNLFMRSDIPASKWEPLLLFDNTVDEWYADEILIFGENNWYPLGTDIGQPGQIPEVVARQWQQNNSSKFSGLIDTFFDSNTGEVQIPANNNFIINGVVSNQSPDSRYRVESLDVRINLPYQGYLARPKFEPDHTVGN